MSYGFRQIVLLYNVNASNSNSYLAEVRKGSYV